MAGETLSISFSVVTNRNGNTCISSISFFFSHRQQRLDIFQTRISRKRCILEPKEPKGWIRPLRVLLDEMNSTTPCTPWWDACYNIWSSPDVIFLSDRTWLTFSMFQQSWLANININVCSIELKWDGKITKVWYDNKMRWIRITVWNGGDFMYLKRLNKLMTTYS